MSAKTRAAIGIVVVVAAIAAFAIARSSSSSRSTPVSSGVVRIVVTAGKPAGGVRRIASRKGARVRFTVTSDVADEIHIHGYDLHKDVAPGVPVSFDFPASIDGIFIVELERRNEQIASLEVRA